MSIPSNQSDDQDETSSSITSGTPTSEADTIRGEDTADDAPSEVAMRISLLGKLIIPPPQP